MPSQSEFPGNSNKKTKAVVKKDEEKPKPEKAVTGEVVKKKPSIGQRVKDIFFRGDFQGVTRYVATEVLLPALRNLIVDSTTKGIERAIYGEVRALRHAPGTSRYQYNNPIYRDRDRSSRAHLPDQPPHRLPPRGRTHTIGDIVLTSKADAETVIERLSDIIDQYEVASVADLYDLLGLSTSFIDNKWGWTELVYADVKQIREGFLIDLPPAEPIE